jgi:hypothetical protein
MKGYASRNRLKFQDVYEEAFIEYLEKRGVNIRTILTEEQKQKRKAD